jgi:hypothetical protein
MMSVTSVYGLPMFSEQTSERGEIPLLRVSATPEMFSTASA